MGNTRLPQKDLKYKPTGRRDRGRPRINGGIKFNFKDRNRLSCLNLRRIRERRRHTYVTVSQILVLVVICTIGLPDLGNTNMYYACYPESVKIFCAV